MQKPRPVRIRAPKPRDMQPEIRDLFKHPVVTAAMHELAGEERCSVADLSKKLHHAARSAVRGAHRMSSKPWRPPNLNSSVTGVSHVHTPHGEGVVAGPKRYDTTAIVMSSESHRLALAARGFVAALRGAANAAGTTSTAVEDVVARFDELLRRPELAQALNVRQPTIAEARTEVLDDVLALWRRGPERGRTPEPSWYFVAGALCVATGIVRPRSAWSRDRKEQSRYRGTLINTMKKARTSPPFDPES